MKIQLYFLILLVGFLFSCSTSPYMKKSELSKDVQYYSQDKQFKLKPDWYWRLRLGKESVNEDVVIGFKYIYNKTGEGKIIGEIIQNNEKFLIAEWQNYGLYFIKEKDFNFAKKFEKYFIPLDYTHNLHPSTYLKSPKNISYVCLPAVLFLQEKVMDKYAFITPEIKQYYNYKFKKIFLQITHCPSFLKFCDNNDIYYQRAEFCVAYLKDIEYTNNYGQLFVGKLYLPIYVILKWGEAYYALPYQADESKNKEN